MRILLVFLAILSGIGAACAQQKKETRPITLWGHVYDKFTRHAVSGAMAYLMSTDSVVIDSARVFYGNNDYGLDANYHFSIPRMKRQYIVKVTHPEFETGYVNVNVSSPGRNTYIDAPWHYLKRMQDSTLTVHNLGEVTVKASYVKMVYRGDTIVYNADAFKLPEGSMLDALIRQLPGAELGSDGTIYLNGVKVDYLTLNGKDFFKGNNKLMLDNLPSYTVKNVKSYRKSSERSEWLGQETEKKDYVLDVSLKREYSIGYTANGEMSGGTHERWAAKLFGMRFTPQSQLSLFANANNTNEVRSPGQDGDWNPQKTLDNGITTTRTAGLNFNVNDKDKRWDESLQVFATHNDNWQDISSVMEQFASSGSLTNRGGLGNARHDVAFSMHNVWKWKDMFSRVKWWLNTRVEYASNGNHTHQWEDDVNAAGDTLNVQSIGERNDNKRINVMQQVLANYRLPWGDNLEMQGLATYTRNFDDNGARQESLRFPLAGRTDDVNRQSQSPYNGLGLNGYVTYQLHALNKWEYEAKYALTHISDHNRYDRFIIEDAGQRQDDDNTRRKRSMDDSHFLTLRAYRYSQVEDKSTWIDASLSVHYDAKHLRWAGVSDTIINDSYFSLLPRFTLQKSSRKSITNVQFLTDMTIPDLEEKVRYVNTENPMSYKLPNDNLKPEHRYELNAYQSFLRQRHNQVFTIDITGAFRHRAIGLRQVYIVNTGKYLSMKDNVNGNYNLGACITFNRDIDSLRRFRFESRMRFDFIHSEGYDLVSAEDDRDGVRKLTGGSLLSKVDNLMPSIRLQLKYSHHLVDAALSGQLKYHHATSGSLSFATINAFTFDYGLSAQLQLPLSLHLAADARVYSRKGYLDKSLNSDDFVCNLSLSRAFIKGRLTARLECFDIFHQLGNVTYSVNVLGRTETRVKSLPGYVMLHVAYRLHINPKRK